MMTTAAAGPIASTYLIVLGFALVTGCILFAYVVEDQFLSTLLANEVTHVQREAALGRATARPETRRSARGCVGFASA